VVCPIRKGLATVTAIDVVVGEGVVGDVGDESFPHAMTPLAARAIPHKK